MTYSIDFRKKVLSVKAKEGLSFKEVAMRFDVGKASVFRWSKELEPCQKRNRVPTKIDREALARDVELFPDAYQYERAERFGVSASGIGLALKSLKISQKKPFNIRKRVQN